MLIKLRKDSNVILNWLLAIEAFLSINPYILWNTYSYYKIFDTGKMFIELIIIFLFLYKRIIISRNELILCISFLFLYTYDFFNSYNKNLEFGWGICIKAIIICIFLSMNKEYKKKIFMNFCKIFAISLIPSIFFWTLSVLNVNVNCDYIKSMQEIKILNNQHYKHFFGCVFRENIYWSPQIKQLCGMFDEPGLVGTVSALILCAKKFDFRKNKELIILILGGLISMSFAFIMICIIYYVLMLFIKKKKKQFKILIVLLISSLVLLFLFKDSEIVQHFFLSRISFSSLINNNRTSQEFDNLFNEFLSTNNVLFGLGNGNPVFDYVDAASYKVLIFNLGIIGFFIIIAWWLCWGLIYSKKNKFCLILVFIFFMSLYQRPWVIYLYFIVIYFGGIEYLNGGNITDENKKNRVKISWR